MLRTTARQRYGHFESAAYRESARVRHATGRHGRRIDAHRARSNRRYQLSRSLAVDRLASSRNESVRTSERLVR